MKRIYGFGSIHKNKPPLCMPLIFDLYAVIKSHSL